MRNGRRPKVSTSWTPRWSCVVLGADVTLVPHEHDDHVGAGVQLGFFQPPGQMLERFPPAAASGIGITHRAMERP